MLAPLGRASPMPSSRTSCTTASTKHAPRSASPTRARAKLLLRLDADSPPPIRDVATLMGCDASYVTALVDALESPGFAERRAAPSDRRVKAGAAHLPG